MGSIGFYWVLLGFIRFYRVLLGLRDVYRVLLGFCFFFFSFDHQTFVCLFVCLFVCFLVSLERRGFYGPGSGFYRVLLGFFFL